MKKINLLKSMCRTEPTAGDETCREFLVFLGETSAVPCTQYLGAGIVMYCDALKNSEEQPRFRAVAEVFYSTPTSEAPCERVIGEVRAIIKDNRFNLALRTLTGMLALRISFDPSKLLLRK
jgi:hypothetical protein